MRCNGLGLYKGSVFSIEAWLHSLARTIYSAFFSDQLETLNLPPLPKLILHVVRSAEASSRPSIASKTRAGADFRDRRPRGRSMGSSNLLVSLNRGGGPI